MTKPIRIQRRRTSGFDLQAESLKRNGLPCVYVGRPTKFGNPYKIGDNTQFGERMFLSVQGAVWKYEKWLRLQLTINPHFLDELRGKNLSCFCGEDSDCHADVILKILGEQ